MAFATDQVQALINTAIGTIVKIASKAGVNGAVLSSTNLIFEPGCSLASHIPMLAIIKYNSGTLGIAVVELDANSIAISATLALLNISISKWGYIPVLLGIISNTGNISVKVNTASILASTFDIEVFGVAY